MEVANIHMTNDHTNYLVSKTVHFLFCYPQNNEGENDLYPDLSLTEHAFCFVSWNYFSTSSEYPQSTFGEGALGTVSAHVWTHG